MLIINTYFNNKLTISPNSPCSNGASATSQTVLSAHSRPSYPELKNVKDKLINYVSIKCCI